MWLFILVLNESSNFTYILNSLYSLSCTSDNNILMQDRVIGILDWELSTLGNQMSDIAYCCLVLSQFSTLVSVMERVTSLLLCSLCSTCHSVDA